MLRVICIGLIAAVAPGCASRATIQGTVLAPGPPTNTTETALGLDGAVVFAVPTGGVAYPAKTSQSELQQTDHGFEPSVLLVAQNTEITFVNRDKVFHNVFSLSPARQFDLGRYGPGEKKTVLFDRIGVVQVFCELHPESFGYIVVLPDRLYARPETNGTFVLPRLPEGEYTVKVWHPTYGERSEVVAVPRKGHVKLDLAY
jgi:plastocyanin